MLYYTAYLHEDDLNWKFGQGWSNKDQAINQCNNWLAAAKELELGEYRVKVVQCKKPEPALGKDVWSSDK